MTEFYGAALESPCSRPPDVGEIMSMGDEIQEWMLEELTKWVQANGGDLSLLLADTSSQWEKDLIKTTWYRGIKPAPVTDSCIVFGPPSATVDTFGPSFFAGTLCGV